MFDRLVSYARFLWDQSIWAEDAIDADEFRYRNLKRLWFPVFDLLCVLIGYLAFLYGSRIMYELYPEWLIDTAGVSFMVASAFALIGVAFPRLFVLEIAGKIGMVGLLGAYSATLWTAFFGGVLQSGMVAGIVMLPVIFPLAKLQILGEEIKQRRSQKAS